MWVGNTNLAVENSHQIKLSNYQTQQLYNHPSLSIPFLSFGSPTNTSLLEKYSCTDWIQNQMNNLPLINASYFVSWVVATHPETMLGSWCCSATFLKMRCRIPQLTLNYSNKHLLDLSTNLWDVQKPIGRWSLGWSRIHSIHDPQLCRQETDRSPSSSGSKFPKCLRRSEVWDAQWKLQRDQNIYTASNSIDYLYNFIFIYRIHTFTLW